MKIRLTTDLSRGPVTRKVMLMMTTVKLVVMLVVMMMMTMTVVMVMLVVMMLMLIVVALSWVLYVSISAMTMKHDRVDRGGRDGTPKLLMLPAATTMTRQRVIITTTATKMLT